MLTVRDAAQRLGCSPQTVRNLIHAGRLPATRRLGTPRGAWQIAEHAFAALTTEDTAAEAQPRQGAA
jgi:excisionase family DNA binding protein